MKEKLYNILQEKGIDDEKHRFRLDWELKEFKKYETITHSKLLKEVQNGSKPNSNILIWYLLGYIDQDPIDEVPERQVIPGKAPDIDIDFEDAERGRVIDYIKRRFGQYNVAQVCNVVKYSIKSAFQDAARIYGIAPQKAIAISKNISENNWNESSAYNQYKEIFDFAEHLLGQMRNFGRHAAAIIVTDKPVQKYVPVQYNADEDILLTEFPGEAVAESKLLKLDILGLSTLKIIKETIRSIKERHNKKIDITQVPLDDPKVFELFSKGLTTSVFQFESASMKGYLQKLQPEKLEDIVVMNALFRPGSIPIINNYIRRRHGEEKVEYEHPVLEKVLKPTLGLLVFQEETIMIAHLASGMSLGRADMLRRYMEKWHSKFKNDTKGKKKWQQEFFEGCKKQGLNTQETEFIWNYLINQTGYQFNRCASGDCVIDADASNKWRPTIREMYKIKNNSRYAKDTNHYPLMKRYRSKKGYGKSYSLCEDGLLRLNKIVDIYYEGEREVFEILLEDGKKIEVTSNHNFPLPDGRKLNIDSGLSVGDYLYINEGYKKQSKAWRRYNFSEISQEPSGKHYSGRGFPLGQDNPGYTNGEYLKFKKNTDELLLEANGKCSVCGKVLKRVERHHKDGNRHNNEKSNLQICCVGCHKKLDYALGRAKKGQKGNEPEIRKIVSIKSIGYKDVYNIEMAAPNHTLSINRIITSNSHSLSYAMIAYYTGWLKVHYPVEFMCASLNSDKTPTDKLLSECKQIGIDVLYPDVNKSKTSFSILDNTTIVYGLSSIKNCGTVPAKWISDNAPYKSIRDFFDKLTASKMGTKVNKRVLDSLICAGAFDELYPNRRVLYDNYNDFRKQKSITSFSEFIKGKLVPDWNKEEKLAYMHDLLTIDIASVIMEQKSDIIEKLKPMLDKHSMIGVITDVARKRDKNGNMMAFVTVHNGEQAQRFPLFSRQFAQNARKLEKNKLLVFKIGKMRDGDLLINSIMIPEV